MVLNVRTYSTLDDGLMVEMSWRSEGDPTVEPGVWLHHRALLRPRDYDVNDAGHVMKMLGIWLTREAEERGV